LKESGILEKGSFLHLKNAKQYIKDADLLFSFKSYRHALALTILSDVELGKAVVYHLLLKDVIGEDTLPRRYKSYLQKGQYELLMSETWFVGLLIASNVEYLVQALLDISDEAGKITANGGDPSACVQRMMVEIIQKMNGEKKNLKKMEEEKKKAFIIDLNLQEADFSEMSVDEKTLIRERISEAKFRIKIGQPFLSLSLTGASRKIAVQLLGEAFRNMLPLKREISQVTSPLAFHFEEGARGIAGKF
jgi:AbiV family abortive infection protein